MTAAASPGAADGRLVRLWHLARTAVFLGWVRLQRRYVGSTLGALWSLANPVGMALILFLVFAHFMRVPIPNYGLYLVAGLIPWTFLSTSLNVATQSLTSRRHVLQSSHVSPVVFVIADVTAELIMFALAYLALLVLAWIMFGSPGAAILALPIVLLPLVVFTGAIGVAVAYLSVRFRDVPHVLQVFLAMMFWLVPVVYAVDMVPEPFRFVVNYNPFALMILPATLVVHGGILPSAKLFLTSAGMAALACLVAWWVRRRLGPDLVYYL